MKKITSLSSERPHFAEWALLCGLFAVVLFTNAYVDIWDTSSNGLYFWDMLFSGRLLEFYAHAPAATDYPITVYLTFAVVNLPIYILKAIFRFAPDAQCRAVPGYSVCVRPALLAHSVLSSRQKGNAEGEQMGYVV